MNKYPDQMITKCPDCDKKTTTSDFFSYNNGFIWFKCGECGREYSYKVKAE